ncbi:putative chitinase [Herbaspirillum sp. Sphag1AN]|nr:putative chitinase [Herbaspirillum sp. Sphag1AN]MBB3246680.1 putative chitinase [Herbaspirillum sp. Sphag64]
MEFGAKNRADRWARFENHARAVSFDRLPQEYKDAQWHFHPTEFIKHFRKCGWRSLRELVQTMPRKSSGGAGGDISWDDAWKRWELGNNKHGYMPPGMNIAINRMWSKYGFFTVRRQAHFLAQIYKETGALRGTSEDGDKRYLRTMYEVLTLDEAGEDYDQKRSWLEAMGFLKKRNRQNYVAQRPDEISKKAKALGNVETGDGSRFRGRGLIHLTGRIGYSAYEKYRSRNFTTDLNAQLLSTDSTSAADSAGYFWVSKMMDSSNTGALRNGLNIHRRADIGTDNANVAAVTTPVTGGKTGLSERQEFLEYVLFILGDSAEISDKLKIKIQNDK